MDTQTPDKEPRKEPIKGKKRKRSWKKIFLYLSGFVVILLIIVRMVLPSIIVTQAEKNATKILKTEVKLANVDLYLMQGKVVLEGLEVASAEGMHSDQIFRIDSVLADVQLTSLLSDTIVIENVEIDAPQANFDTMTDGRRSLAEFLKAFEKEEAPPVETETPPTEEAPAEEPVEVEKSGAPKAIRVDRLAINNLQFNMYDAFAGETPSTSAVEFSGLEILDFNFVPKEITNSEVPLTRLHLEALRVTVPEKFERGALLVLPELILEVDIQDILRSNPAPAIRVAKLEKNGLHVVAESFPTSRINAMPENLEYFLTMIQNATSPGEPKKFVTEETGPSIQDTQVEVEVAQADSEVVESEESAPPVANSATTKETAGAAPPKITIDYLSFQEWRIEEVIHEREDEAEVIEDFNLRLEDVSYPYSEGTEGILNLGFKMSEYDMSLKLAAKGELTNLNNDRKVQLSLNLANLPLERVPQVESGLVNLLDINATLDQQIVDADVALEVSRLNLPDKFFPDPQLEPEDLKLKAMVSDLALIYNEGNRAAATVDLEIPSKEFRAQVAVDGELMRPGVDRNMNFDIEVDNAPIVMTPKIDGGTVEKLTVKGNMAPGVYNADIALITKSMKFLDELEPLNEIGFSDPAVKIEAKNISVPFKEGDQNTAKVVVTSENLGLLIDIFADGELTRQGLDRSLEFDINIENAPIVMTPKIEDGLVEKLTIKGNTKPGVYNVDLSLITKGMKFLEELDPLNQIGLSDPALTINANDITYPFQDGDQNEAKVVVSSENIDLLIDVFANGEITKTGVDRNLDFNINIENAPLIMTPKIKEGLVKKLTIDGGISPGVYNVDLSLTTEGMKYLDELDRLNEVGLSDPAVVVDAKNITVPFKSGDQNTAKITVTSEAADLLLDIFANGEVTKTSVERNMDYDIQMKNIPLLQVPKVDRGTLTSLALKGKIAQELHDADLSLRLDDLIFTEEIAGLTERGMRGLSLDLNAREITYPFQEGTTSTATVKVISDDIDMLIDIMADGELTNLDKSRTLIYDVSMANVPVVGAQQVTTGTLRSLATSGMIYNETYDVDLILDVFGLEFTEDLQAAVDSEISQVFVDLKTRGLTYPYQEGTLADIDAKVTSTDHDMRIDIQADGEVTSQDEMREMAIVVDSENIPIMAAQGISRGFVNSLLTHINLNEGILSGDVKFALSSLEFEDSVGIVTKSNMTMLQKVNFAGVGKLSPLAFNVPIAGKSRLEIVTSLFKTILANAFASAGVVFDAGKAVVTGSINVVGEGAGKALNVTGEAAGKAANMSKNALGAVGGILGVKKAEEGEQPSESEEEAASDEDETEAEKEESRD